MDIEDSKNIVDKLIGEAFQISHFGFVGQLVIGMQ